MPINQSQIGQIIPATRTGRTKYPVRIFSANPIFGNHRFSTDDLKVAVDNYNRYQLPRIAGWPVPQAAYLPDFVLPELQIGHEPDQAIARAILSRTDLPSIGEPTRVWMQGPDMFAELDGIPEELASMINAGQFKQVSATLYPNYRTPDGIYHGPTLRGLSVLGYEQPKLKGLGRIPPIVWSDPARNGRAGQQYVAVFSEGPFMTREEANAILTKFGIEMPADSPDAFAIMIAQKMVELSPAVAQEVNPGETQPTAVTQPAPSMGQPMMFSEQVSRAVDARLAAAIAPVMTQLTNLGNTIAAQSQASQRQEILTFSETERARLYPFELDPNNESYIVNRLLAMPAPARAAEMKAIRSRPKFGGANPVLRFSEQAAGMPDPVLDETGEHGRRVGASADGAVTDERKRQLLSKSKIGRAVLARQAITGAAPANS